MTQVQVAGECSASLQNGLDISNNHDVSLEVIFGEGDQFCVRFKNGTSTNVTVTTWVSDTEGGGDLTDTNFSVPIPAGETVNVWFWDFGLRADQVSRRTKASLHIHMRNDDSENEGVEIGCSVHH
jgi:hypothetical protein